MPTAQEALGVGHRLKEGPDRLLAHSAFAHELDGAEYMLNGLSFADLAHLAVLVEGGIVDRSIGGALLENLLSVHPELPGLTLDPSVGDLYNNRDRRLVELFGRDAGWIHVGRARREATTIAWQMAVRERLLELADGLSGLLATLLGLARDHRHTVMPDFTYMHHAHPTTLAHYLLGYAFPIERDIERCRRAFALVNRSPAGSGSVNGSRFDIDRHRLAQLLGFDGIVDHTRDAMWAHDMAIEPMTVVTTAMVNIDRLTEELLIWNTEEFGFVDFDDAHARTSVIMPQKKNPYALTFLRGESRELLGRWIGVAATGLTPSGQPDNRFYAYIEVPQALDRAVRASKLLAAVLEGSTFHHDRMEAAAGSGYTYATDMCDVLTLAHGLDNRTAHSILGTAVTRCIAEGGRPITADDVVAIADEAGIDLSDLDRGAFDGIRDPRTLIAVRQGHGGAGPAPMASMLAALGERLDDHRSWVGEHPLRGFHERFTAEIRSMLTGRTPDQSDENRTEA